MIRPMSAQTPFARSDVALMFGLAGAVTALAVALFGNTTDLRHVWVDEVGMVLLAALGAWASGWICGPMFGHPGGWGWFAAAIGAGLSTMLGAAIAGTLMVPFLGTLLAPLILLELALQAPVIVVVWLAAMAGLHIFVVKTV